MTPPTEPAVSRRTALGRVAVVGAVLALGGRGGTAAAQVATPAQAATPAGATAEETLVDVTLPPAVLPHGVAGAGFAELGIPAAPPSTWTVPEAVQLTYMLAGSVTIRSDHPWRRLHGGTGTWAEVPATSDAAIGPGDAALFLSPAITIYTNASLTLATARLVGWVLTAGPSTDNPVPPEWEIGYVALSGAGALDVPPGPARLRLRRATLTAHGVFPPTPGAIVQFGIPPTENAAGIPTEASVDSQRDGRIVNNGEATPIYIITLEPRGAAARSPVAASPTPP